MHRMKKDAAHLVTRHLLRARPYPDHLGNVPAISSAAPAGQANRCELLFQIVGNAFGLGASRGGEEN
jgi:hypothetical protein